jgi:hypothetical protein
MQSAGPAATGWLRVATKAKPQVAGESAWGFYRLDGGSSGEMGTAQFDLPPEIKSGK